MKRSWLLVSDVDGTLLGDDAATKRFAEFYDRHHDWFRVAYCSGRFYESIMESVSETPLPVPDIVIGGVGTEIRTPPTGECVEAWNNVIAQGWNPDTVRHALQEVDGLVLQPREFQSPFKVSYYYENASPEAINALARRVQRANVAAKIIYSSQRDLDFLPAKADKGAAAEFLAGLWAFPPERVAVSGDSGNDAALFQKGFRGIVVGNAHHELKALEDPLTYHARAAFADGVLEGLQFWINGEG